MRPNGAHLRARPHACALPCAWARAPGVRSHAFTRPTLTTTAPRSLEIIAAGCRHFGVREAYVEELLKRPCEPRTAPADFIAIEVPAGTPLWDEARLAAEPVSENSVTFALNGVVTRMTGGSVVGLLKRMGAHGKHTEEMLAAALFDPLYGVPAKLGDFTREHCAYLRDLITRMWSKAEGMTVEVVATMQQVHCDDEPLGGAGVAGAAGQ